MSCEAPEATGATKESLSFGNSAGLIGVYFVQPTVSRLPSASTLRLERK